MAFQSHLAHHSNNNHARGIHDQDKEINHIVNYSKAKFRSVTLVHKFQKCCNNFSCEECKKANRKSMKPQQVKAITISPLSYKQTGKNTLRWPPLNNFGPNSGYPPDAAYRQGVCHFLVTGKEVNIAGRKRFSPEHVDGPVIEKRNDTFKDKAGNVWAFIRGESSSASENEIMEYDGTASDNNLPVELPRKHLSTVLKEEREEKAKLEKEKAKLQVEKANTVQFLSHKLKVDENGNNLLHQAALEEKNQNVSVFLENKLFDLEAKNNLGETALHCALKVGNDEAFQLLRDFGADLSQTFQDKKGKVCSSISRDEDGDNLLQQSLIDDDITDVIKCLESNLFDLEAKNKEEKTALHCAARSGNVEVVKLLLEKEAKLEAKDDKGETPLLTAIRHQHEQVVEQLITSGADSEARNDGQETALHLTSFWGNTKIVELLLERKPNLLEAKDEVGKTPLFTAIIKGHEQVSEQLIISGADLEARNKHQQTPFCIASSLGNIKIVQLLLERKPNVEAKDEDENTPLITAIQQRHQQVAKHLIISGADLEARNNREETPLHCASYWGNIKIVQLLLEKNPNLLEAKDEDGNTPLNIAEKYKMNEVLTLLQNVSSNLNSAREVGKTRLPSQFQQ